MILKLSLTVLLLYYLVVLWKYYRQDIAGIFGTAETDEDTDGTGKEPGQPGKPYTVMGESTYLPFAAEDGEEAAAGAVDEPAAEDDGADYSDIEPEEDEEETDYEPTPEEIRELEEEEELGAYYPDGNPDFATGYSFDDLKKVRRVLVSDNADEKAEREAREVLPSVMGSDIWEAGRILFSNENGKLCAAALEMNFVPHHHLAPSMWHPPPESGDAHGGEP